MRQYNVRNVLCYLFAALSEADSHTLTREELPYGGRLARPQSRFVVCGQRIQLERLSKLLNLIQSVSPLSHLQLLINHLCVTLLLHPQGNQFIICPPPKRGQRPATVQRAPGAGRNSVTWARKLQQSGYLYLVPPVILQSEKKLHYTKRCFCYLAISLI